ncbi:MAG: SUMF1/EgtB/PvdO family nonheme iron enzyme [Anaerolineae bacterium]|nr:SUMF1/EgtB/PvdO family nonheme iron enzyme [Anaerolineae bacterium]
MARIFISYSRKDETIARRLAADLDRLGADIWIDVDDIPAGMKWSTAIQQGLDSCEVMIVIISPDAMASRNVEDEWQAYLDDSKPIIPILWRPARVHFQLRRIQYIDFHTQDYDTAFAQLHSALRRKRIYIAPLSDTDPSVQIPAQKLLPVQGEEFPRSYLAIGATGLVLVAVVIFLLLSGVLGGGDGEPEATAETQSAASIMSTPTDQPETGATAVVSQQTPLPPEAQVPLDLTNTALAQPTATPMPTSTPTQTPNYDATYNAVATHIMGTEMASWTDTPAPTATATIRPTDTPAPVPTEAPINALTPMPSPIPAGSSNRDWTPASQEINGVTMMLVPAGCFMMGSETGTDNEKPVHEICFDEPFWIDRTEVTRGMYTECVADGVCSETLASNYSTENNQPINNLTWFQAKDYCAWREARLPTEAEWEYAARGPEGWTYPWGDEFAWNYVVYSGNSPQTAEVGSRPDGASWVGALDMSGNVWEWTSTINEAYPYRADDGREDNSDANSSRVLRGGSFFDDSSDSLRAAFRNWNHPGLEYFNIFGFRCARSH